jgi:putative transposase
VGVLLRRSLLSGGVDDHRQERRPFRLSRAALRRGTERFGRVDKDLARGISLRHDWGPQYTSGHFQGAISWLGIEDSPAFAGEPPCNGCAERFIRTLKEQCLWARLYEDVEDLGQAVIAFSRRYNDEWLIERHGHCTPRDAYAAAIENRAA